MKLPNRPSRSESTALGSTYLRTGVLATVSLTVLFFLFISDDRWTVSGKPAADMFIGAAVLNVVLYVLIRTSGKSWVNLQVPLLGALVLTQIGLVASLKMEGVYGNGRPKIVWRWQSSPADDFYDRVSELESQEMEERFSTEARLDEWTGFRGRFRDGVSNVSLSAGGRPEKLWSRPVGSGWSSFAVSGDVCVTQEQRGEMEMTVCYLVETGQEIWATGHRARFSEVTAGDGPRSTPEIDGPFVYSFGATGILSCLELSGGKLVWSVDVFEEIDGKNRIFGMAGSPLIVDDKVVVAPGGQGTSLVAFEKTTGPMFGQAATMSLLIVLLRY